MPALRQIVLSLLAATLLSTTLFAQTPAVERPLVTLDQALAGVRWQGRVPSQATIGDKTPIVLVYATWCPKCNVWTPELFAQLAESIKDQPVILFAVNADETVRGVDYALQRKLVGPNIFHGDDPNIVARMGFQSELFNYSIFQDGQQTNRKQAGGYYNLENGQKEFALSRQIKTGLEGKFSFLTDKTSDALKQVLWPLELGSNLDERSLLAMRKKMDEPLANEFNSAISDFLDGQVKEIADSRKGTVPQQIKGYEMAEAIATNFKSTPQGRACRGLLDKLEEDKAFQEELTAKKLYDQAMQKGTTPVTLRRMMGRASSRFPEAYYGKEAQKVIDSVQ
ncbi:hypothetical protein DTL42_19100 [Bremerella cremea]|uniref:Thioredoxin domain-containing protein n=1 Tax=Bremerella cremea TaxID=1031537 RepID=A0A368KPP1_9BACT|nr:protein disulfide isomerase family protein [Bremerella cremea]RCS43265.1 hypothetical protein DTL42_19100 [Bremerella cremea]